MFLFVKFESGKALSIDCSEDDTVENLIREVGESSNVAFKGIILERKRRLSDYGINQGALLEAV